MSQSGDHDSIDVELRPDSAVARRCIILFATIQRIGLAESAPDHQAEDPAAAAFDLREWLRLEGLWSDLTQKERELLDSPLRRTATHEVQERVPETEAFATIAWSLGLIDELPDLGPTAYAHILASIPLPWEKSAPWIAAQSLRLTEEIIRRREQAEIWEWRLAIESDRRLIEGRELMELEQTIRDVAREGTAVGLLHSEPVDDVSFVGESLSRLDAEQLEEFHGLAQERLVALNWLCGHGHDWDDAPLDIEGLSLD